MRTILRSIADLFKEKQNLYKDVLFLLKFQFFALQITLNIFSLVTKTSFKEKKLHNSDNI